ncbi:uncharacterized protein FOMMEDRAFT_27368 [Fomitiporia mediterranea MF3/22]|uniref:uncharacterized protein n=1 Tax=Fomitiporia mediterranea (strain MF3/22) TaxID=694068 RepID=UPI0004409137|nr:uncharacterized protein FOMMEDRAFT_27368 [Fomitiporia mediterranea MF3/22]EJD05171.1 hypothetical protein FOMMEDRAFT_27368 [Fomitiporia mediterranea MF3/22]
MADVPDSVPAWSHKSCRLCTDLRFKTYSDAKLAGLFLENYFPISFFKEVFDVIVDPDFNSDDVTFDSIWDMFSYISTCRQKDVLERDAAVALLQRDGSSLNIMVPRGIPRDILGLWSSDALSFTTNKDSDFDLELNWDEHPPPQLKTIDLFLSGFEDLCKDDLTWLLKSRNSFSLDSLSIYLECNSLNFLSPSNSSSLHAVMRDCLPGIEKSLKLVIHQSPIHNLGAGCGPSTSVPGQFYSNVLKSASNLENLEMFFSQSNLCSVCGPFNLPPSLEILTIHLEDNYDHPSTPTSIPASPNSDLQDLQVWFSSVGIEKFILERLPTLPHLCKVVITRSPPLDQNILEGWDLDALTDQPYYMDQITIQRGIQRGQDIISELLRTICRERNIDFVFVDNAFPKTLDIPRGERHAYSPPNRSSEV